MKYCCGLEAVWVDNVPTKEYWYCKECKQEVPETRNTGESDDKTEVDLTHFSGYLTHPVYISVSNGVPILTDPLTLIPVTKSHAWFATPTAPLIPSQCKDCGVMYVDRFFVTNCS